MNHYIRSGNVIHYIGSVFRYFLARIENFYNFSEETEYQGVIQEKHTAEIIAATKKLPAISIPF